MVNSQAWYWGLALTPPGASKPIAPFLPITLTLGTLLSSSDPLVLRIWLAWVIRTVTAGGPRETGTVASYLLDKEGENQDPPGPPRQAWQRQG